MIDPTYYAGAGDKEEPTHGRRPLELKYRIKRFFSNRRNDRMARELDKKLRERGAYKWPDA